MRISLVLSFMVVLALTASAVQADPKTSSSIGGYICAIGGLNWPAGVQFPSVDWGDMLGAGTQAIESGFWWQIVSPGAAIVVTVVAFVMLGDGLRDGFAGDE